MSIPEMTVVSTGENELKRTCPRCLQEQVVSQEDKLYAVPCKFCGAAMPPLENHNKDQ